MIVEEEAAPAAVGLAEAQAYLRLESGEEEAVLAGLVRSATGLCEQFTGLTLIARTMRERIRVGGQWTRLSATPVRTIDAVEAIGEGVLEPTRYAIDIDARGDGWVRLTDGGERMLVVSATVGMAKDGNGVAEPLRQGIVRLAAHLFNNRDGDSGEPPAAVTALWRPYRRMRLA